VYRFEALMQECGATADDLIRRIGSTVSGCFRTTDTVARWSTTEFAVILPGEDHYGAIRAVEKAMEALNRLVVPGQDGQDHSVTLCAGLAIANEKTPLDEAVSQAERNLCESFADCQASGSSSIVAPDARQTPRRTERVAICVADIKMGRAIGQMLERDRFTIKLFATAEELLTGLSERRFNLLIADDELPLGGETHLLERIRALRQCSRLRIIMLVAGESSIVRVMELGADDYAIKPPDITSFISRIRRLLSGSEALSQRHTVMILDHEIPQLLVAGTTLYKRCGCRVLLAHGVEDALQRLSADTPDFLILDLDIPESSLKHFISLLPRNKDLEIITAASSAATTADISTEDFRVRGHLTRPFKPDTLLKEFRGIIPLAGEPPKSKGSEPDIIDVEIRRILTLRR
jgi:DNA-binding response OmpR family regulator